MLLRVLEPEFMDCTEDSESYDEMDHQQVNQCFVDDLVNSGPIEGDVLDLGTGTARIPIALCEQNSDCRVLAVDAAASMLEIARLNIAVSCLEHQIDVRQEDCKGIAMDDDTFDVVISNSLLHHIPDPKSLVAEAIRVARPGGRIFIRDLYRPSDSQTVEKLVNLHASEEPAGNQQLLRQSLHAALTLEEIQDIVSEYGFAKTDVRYTSDRHWTWSTTVPPLDAQDD